MSAPALTLCSTVVVRIEVSKGGFIKRAPGGRVDLVSPFPCPYNYGSIVGTLADDGEPVDAVVIGPRLRVGSEVEVSIQAIVGFVDAGLADPKFVCANRSLRAIDRFFLTWFFRGFARAKRTLQRIGGERGRTAYTGWVG